MIQPLRGIGALYGEIRGNTIELMVLTRLTAWRIVLGKWISIFAQTALLFVAVFPYLILRYFLGGMDLFAELTMLTSIFLLSGVFTALTVGLSALPSVPVRGLVPMAGGVVVAGWIFSLMEGDLFARMTHSFDLGLSSSRLGIFGGVLTGSYIAWLLLSLAASIIAPAAENHSTRQRLVAAGSLLLIGLLSPLFHPTPNGLSLAVFLIVLPALILAVSEPFQLLPSTTEPFLRRGTAGRLSGRLLYPGWPSGILYGFTLMALAGAVFILHRSLFDTNYRIWLLSMVSMFFFPVVILGLFPKVKSRFGLYLLVLVVSFVAPTAAEIVAKAMPGESHSFLWAFCWLPSGLNSLVPQGVALEGVVWNVAVILTATYVILSLAFVIPRLSAISEVEEESLGIPKPESP